MPIRHGGNALKNVITRLRRSCFLTTTFSLASISVNLKYVLRDI